MQTLGTYYQVSVWYRFVSNGEIEKGDEIHKTYALTPEHAKLKVTNEYYNSLSAIPFNYDVKEIN